MQRHFPGWLLRRNPGLCYATALRLNTAGPTKPQFCKSNPAKRTSMHSNPNNSITPDLTERFTNLVDGRTGLRSGLQVEVSEPADDRAPSTLKEQSSTIGSQPPPALNSQPILDFIASDETLDRCDEVIQAGGWR